MHKFYHMNCFLDLGSSNRSIYNNYIFKEGAPPLPGLPRSGFLWRGQAPKNLPFPYRRTCTGDVINDS